MTLLRWLSLWPQNTLWIVLAYAIFGFVCWREFRGAREEKEPKSDKKPFGGAASGYWR